MKKPIFFLTFIACLMAVAVVGNCRRAAQVDERFQGIAAARVSGKSPTSWEVYFAPGKEPEEAIVREIKLAQHTILIHAFGFTSEPIGDALIEALRRDVAVKAILDRSDRDAANCQAGRIRHAGAEVWFDAKHPIAHAKVLCIDGKTVIQGSYNYTAQAIHNSECLTVFRDKEMAKEFAANWERHKIHAEK